MKCPECAAGKTPNCALIALDFETDEFVPCETTLEQEQDEEAIDFTAPAVTIEGGNFWPEQTP